MIHNRWSRGGAAVACLFRALCSGGGSDAGGVPVVSGGGTGSTPTPTPTSSPSPPPSVGARTGVLEPPSGAVTLAAAMELTRTERATSQRSYAGEGLAAQRSRS